MNLVFVARNIPSAGLQAMEKVAKVTVSELDRELTSRELSDRCKGCDVLVATPANKINGALLRACPEIRLIASFGAGIDHVDLKAAKEHGVVVTNTPGVVSKTTADLSLALILAVTRRLVEGDRLIRSGGFRGIHPTFMLGFDLFGKTLGIFGLGRIGVELARRANVLGMKVIYHNRNRNKAAESELNVKYVPFGELLRQSDVVSVHAPLSSQTKGLFDYAAFSSMKKGAYFVNVARGAIHVEEDLVRGLEEGLIAGAALDVYENEPSVHPRLLTMQNVVLAPHLGTATEEVRTKMALTVAENVIAFLEDRDPPNRVV